jgi:hypothetical protein
MLTDPRTYYWYVFSPFYQPTYQSLQRDEGGRKDRERVAGEKEVREEFFFYMREKWFCCKKFGAESCQKKK